MSRRNKVKLAFYRRSLKKWRERHAYRKRKADIAHQRNDRNGVKKWYTLMKEAGVEIRRRRAQIETLTPRPRPQAPKRALVIAKARSYIGVRERYWNGGGIINVWQQNFGFGRVPWCGLFCGNMLRAVGISVPSAIASVALIEGMARRKQRPFRGWSTDEKTATRGDLAIIGGYGQHVEMVEQVHADGSLTTIGGNTGDAVRRMNRPRSSVRGIAQVNFPG
jgi:hypothetical protein